MTAIFAILVGLALFCWWLTGNWYARAVAYLPVVWVAANIGGESGWPVGLAAAAVGWVAVSLPIWLRRPAPTPVAVAAVPSEPTRPYSGR